jgi:hypothetical protein
VKAPNDFNSCLRPSCLTICVTILAPLWLKRLADAMQRTTREHVDIESIRDRILLAPKEPTISPKRCGGGAAPQSALAEA